MIYTLKKNEHSEIAGHTVIYETDIPSKYVYHYRKMKIARRVFTDLDPELHFLRYPTNQARVAVEIIPVMDEESGNLAVLIQTKENISHSRDTRVCQDVLGEIVVPDWNIISYERVQHKQYASVHLAETLTANVAGMERKK